MQNFQGVGFTWTRTYSETFKSALMYFFKKISGRNSEEMVIVIYCLCD